MRKFTFRWLLSLMVVMGFAFSSNAQYLTEDFEGGALPSGWTEEIGAATDSWTFNTDASSSYWTIPAHTVYAAVNEDACNCDMSDTRIVSSVFDLSTATAPVLSFDAIPRDGACTIQAFDGTTWSDVATLTNGSAWAAQVVDLSAYAGQANVQIAFHYNDNGGWGYGLAIDDVSVREMSSETDITAFSFPGEETGAATIDATNHTVDIEVAASTDLTTLVATFGLSVGASSTIGATAQVSGTTANDFTAAVTYTVTAEDGSTTQDWIVTTTQASISSENDITAYSFAEETGAATIDATGHTVAIEVNWQADLTNLTATFSVSAGANAAIGATAQVSGTTANDFSAAVTYDVTAEDGTTIQPWTVTVTQEATPAGMACDNPLTAVIGMNSADNSAGDQWFEYTATANGNLTVTTCTYTSEDTRLWAYSDCPATTEVANSDDACSTQSEGVFAVTAGLTYYIQWGDNYTSSTFDFELIFVEASTETDILTFSHLNETGTATIDATAHTVDLEVTYATDLTTFVADFTLSAGANTAIGATAQISGTTANDFSTGSLTYDVTAEDGTTAQAWTVTVTNAIASPEKAILTFDHAAQTGVATIDATAFTVDLEVGAGTDLTTLVANFTLSDFADAAIGATAQVSGTTANDFSTGALTYTVTAEDATTQDWVVTVTEAVINDETDILTYSFAEETGAATIDAGAHTVNIEVNACADLTNLTPTYTLSYGATTTQTATDFSSDVIYNVVAEDASTNQDWTVTVTKAAAPAEVDCAAPAAHMINGADYTNALCSSTPLYVEVTLDQDYVNVRFETCGSDFDTKLAFFANCADITDDMTTSPSNPTNNLGYNDDDCANYASGFDITTLSAGTYIACLYGYGTSSGNIQFRVTGTPASEVEITSYDLPGQDASNIDAANDSIMVTMPTGTMYPVTLAANFVLSTNATATVATVDQVTGTTENTWADATTPVVYAVLGEDGITVKNWSVYVMIASGINNVIDSKDVTIYPNPNNGQFNIALNLNVNTVNIEVLNSLGQVVAQYNDVDANTTQTINLDQVAEGMYYIRVSSNNNIIVKKVNVIK